jgi:hypothetical protein
VPLLSFQVLVENHLLLFLFPSPFLPLSQNLNMNLLAYIPNVPLDAYIAPKNLIFRDILQNVLAFASS